MAGSSGGPSGGRVGGGQGSSFTSYSIDNDKKFRAALERAKAQCKDLTVPLKDISRDFYKSQKAIFMLKGPGQYPDLDEKYAERKEQEVGFIYPILQKYGHLAASTLSPTARYAINKIVDNKQALIIGTSIPYGIFHQSDAPRKKIPLRKFLFIGPESIANAPIQKGEIAGRAERWLNILNSFVLAKMGLVGEVAGVKLKGSK